MCHSLCLTLLGQPHGADTSPSESGSFDQPAFAWIDDMPALSPVYYASRRWRTLVVARLAGQRNLDFDDRASDASGERAESFVDVHPLQSSKRAPVAHAFSLAAVSPGAKLLDGVLASKANR